MLGELVSEVQKNGRPFKAVTLNRQPVELVSSFQSHDAAIWLPIKDLFNTNTSICKRAMSIGDLDLSWMSSLEVAYGRGGLRELGLKSAHTNVDTRVIDFESLAGKVIRGVFEAGYFVKFALEHHFIDLIMRR